MNAAERDQKIGQLKREINAICISLSIGSIFVLCIWWGLEPMMKQVINLNEEGGELLTTITTVFFDYVLVVIYAIGYISALVAIFMKKRMIRKYKKEKDVSPKINIKKDDISQKPVYVIDHSKDKTNQYEIGDRDMMKRVFNQNNNISTNSGKRNTSKTRSERHSVRAYNGSTRSSNNTESNNTALDIALASSMYSSNNDNDCSPSSNSSSDYSSGGSGFDGGSSCD
ncbi:hypothetical protein SIM55_22935 [Bacillus cereus group sp. BfR-BA-02675]|uniref:hypothetical protein n=1 Tax=Bacillus cereus group TaxID=86661 RepID=UPI000BBA0C9F|nr:MULTISPECIES: hypothetical protein [Bacillus cereus group]PCC77327.1 hypothetical protein CNQ76_23565 [Bacillus cereus]MCC2475748.1 hypothetical protein [Bacillus paranthracis]MDX5768548.1 hypothetical protein [Bacillus cereus group sp. BfR-BA-02675]MDX5891470.1 hypothetical protein [Bacillus cereus group sp. BfR-BA-01039]PDR74731.1 hypothetical protein CNQ81_23070 [Bacillus cereus]